MTLDWMYWVIDLTNSKVIYMRKQTPRTSVRAGGNDFMPLTGERIGDDIGNSISVDLDLSADPIFRGKLMYVDARYHDQTLELDCDANNMLILALPPLHDPTVGFEPLKKLAGPELPRNARKMSAEKKLLLLSTFSDRLVLLPIHVAIYEWMHMSLRHHYRHLDPMTDLQRDMQRSYDQAQQGKPSQISVPDRAHSRCKAIIGMSGMGKSTAVKMILSLFPCVIKHKIFQDAPCPVVQAVWVYITCPPTGSVDLLLRSIIRWYDEHLGTRYMKELSSKPGIPELLAKVEMISKRHYTGLMVLDEIQNSLINAERHHMLDFVVNWLNSNCCCFLVMGTPEAEPVIKKRLRTARRLNIDHLNPFVDGRPWKKFFDGQFEFDMMPQRCVRKVAVSQKLLDLSAGITGLAKMILEFTQYYGVRDKSCSRITPELMQWAAEIALDGVEGMVEALRTRDGVRIAAYADMALVHRLDCEERIENALNEQRLFAEVDLRSAAARRDEAVEALTLAAVPHRAAVDLVETILEGRPDLALPQIVSEALQKHLNPAAVRKGPSRSNPAKKTARPSGRGKTEAEYARLGLLHEASRP